MKHIVNVLIMAAGRGNRMMPLTADIPKPMAPFWGSTLIADGIRRIEKSIENVHVTVGYKGAILSEHLINLGVASIFNTEGHGNSWWIYNTLIKNLNKPIFVLTCDNLVELEFEVLEEEYFSFNQPACMVVPVVPVKNLEGDYIFQDNNIVTKFDRKEVSDYYCSGVQILNPYKINQITKPTEDFYSVWNQLIVQKQVYVSSRIPKRWFAVDTMEHLEQISKQAPWT
jgi:NDP-sugar pyrophosphorylase family protein